MIRLGKLAVVVSLGAIVAALAASQPLAVSSNIVISQVYGGGGNSGAEYTNDYIELFNRGSTTVSLSGWSLQYASATGTGNFGASSTQITDLSGSLAPGQYLLVQEAQGAGGTTPLPTPDVTDTTPINMSGTGGKVALVNTTTSLGCNGGSTPCSTAQLAQIIDLVGWGSANFFEGTVGPTTSNTTAALRNGNGCTETDDNGADFTAGTPTPRNSSSPRAPCAAPTNPTGVGSASPAAVAPGSSSLLTVAVTPGSNPASTGLAVSGDLTAIGGSSSQGFFDDGTNGDVAAGDNTFSFLATVSAATTPGAKNLPATITDAQARSGSASIALTVADCAASYTPVYDIQGAGSSAAITGNVTTQGVVVGDFEGSTSQGGFYIQDATGDGDTATSDGIFVYTGSADLVSAGDLVRVAGYARERFSQTTLNGSNSNSSAVPSANIVHCGTGSVPATDVEMPFASADYPERYEGMYVRFPQSLVISEYFNYDRFGEMVLALPLAGETRPFTGTAIDEPGTAANARTEANSLRRITLDDANSAQNPAVLRHPNGDPFSLTNRFRGGDTVQNAVGVLGYDFSLYRIFPTGPAAYTATNPRPAAPGSVGGSLHVGSLNTLNYFLTPDYPGTGNPLDNKCGPAQDVECRGWDADQPDELTRQRTKLLATITGVNADVMGLNELENTAGVEPLADIVSGLSGYAYINTGTIGTDAIRVGLIYKSAKVTPVGDFQILDSSDDPRFIDTLNRPALAQTFDVNATGARFTVVVNHLKSKGSACTDDPDTGDGQGNCNGTRTAAAQALVDWLATDPTGSGDADFLIVGDLNSYAKEDPIDAVKAGPDDTAGTADDYTNLVFKYQGTYAYSYLFDGQFGYLDHALSSASLTSQVTGATEWHINADEPDVLDYDTTFKPPSQDALYEPNAYRTSDHDPVLVGLDLVGFDFNGFFRPVDNLPMFNAVKAGQGIPVKFSLGGNQGLDIFSAGYPKSRQIACDLGTGDGAEETITAGNSGLTYDPFNDTYTYVWKTDKGWANTCRQLVVQLTDGGVHRANFQFQK
jgi:predicted extracellular nuclease